VVCWRVEFAPWLILLGRGVSAWRGMRGEGTYERKVDLPHEGSPRRRMLIEGGEAIGGRFARGHCEGKVQQPFIYTTRRL